MLQAVIAALVPLGAMVPAFVGLLMATLIPAAYRVLHINASVKARADMQVALKNGLYFALGRLHAGGVNPALVPTNAVLVQNCVALAKDYLNDNADSLMKHLGVDQNSLAKAIEAQVLTVVNSYTWSHGQIMAVANDPLNAVPGNTVNVSAASAASDSSAMAVTPPAPSSPPPVEKEVDGSQLPPITGTFSSQPMGDATIASNGGQR